MLFEQVEDQAGLARAWLQLGFVNHQHFQGAVAEESLERALVYARRVGDGGLANEIMMFLPQELAAGPRPVTDALHRCRQIAEQTRGNPIAECNCASIAGLLEAMRGQFDEARGLCSQARQIAETLGVPFLLASVDRREWEIEMLAGDLNKAERAIRRRYEILASLSEKSFRSTAAANLAYTLVALGRLDEGLRLARISEELAASDDLHSQVPLRLARAKVMAQRSDLDGAEALAREALALVEQTDYLDIRGIAMLDLAEVLAMANRAEEAHGLLDGALRLYERKGNIVMAGRAPARLEELGEAPLKL